MIAKSKKQGFSLTEMVVVVAIIALLTALGLPAIRSLQNSFEKGSGVKATINAALSAARAIAAREQRYAGVRFQLDIHGNQYMIFIIHDPEKTGLSNGFRALEGQKPIKLPDDIRVIDTIVRGSSNASSILERRLGKPIIFDSDTLDSPDKQNRMIRDTSCFSVIFSPAGKLVTHEVRVRNRNGIHQPVNSITGKVSMDDIFNSPENILNYNVGMFFQDDEFPSYVGLYGEGCLGEEFSRSKIYIYDKSYFDKLMDPMDRANYLRNREPIFINQYTGTLIKSEN